MKPIATGLALSCLMLLSACSGKVQYIQKTEYLVCGNVKALATQERHPGRYWMNQNGDLLDLIDRYSTKLTIQNERMAEIQAEVDSCEQKARKMNFEESS